MKKVISYVVVSIVASAFHAGANIPLTPSLLCADANVNAVDSKRDIETRGRLEVQKDANVKTSPVRPFCKPTIQSTAKINIKVPSNKMKKETSRADSLSGDWISLGECTYTDPFITGGVFDEISTPLEYNVSIEESAENPGIFRLVHPYGREFAVAMKNKYGLEPSLYQYDSAEELYLTIDAQDPDKVFIPEQSLGVALNGNGDICGLNMGAFMRDINDETPGEDECGKFIDGVISIPMNTAIIRFSNINSYYYANSNGDVNMISMPNYGWGEWEEIGRTSFPESFMNSYNINIPYHCSNMNEWDGSAIVKQRFHLTDSTKQQLQLCNVFNGVDIVLDYDKSNNVLTCSQQNTGLILNDTSFDYSQFKFGIKNGSYYYPASGKITLNICLYVSSDMGLNFGSGHILLLDGFEEVVFNISFSKTFISSKEEPKVDVHVEHSDIVKSWRVAIFDLSKGVSRTYTEIEDLMRPIPNDSSLVYRDYSAEDFTIDLLSDGPNLYQFFSIPFGADGHAIDGFKNHLLLLNQQLNGEWKSLGKVTMTDVLGHNYLPTEDIYDLETYQPKLPPITREVELEECCDTPGLYRVVNPYGKTHPMYEKMVGENNYDISDDFYMYIDACDPSRVYIRFSILGPSFYYNPLSLDIISGKPLEYLDMYDGQYWGKKFDNHISFNLNSLTSIRRLGNFKYDLEILLPEYEAFPIEWTSEAPSEDGVVEVSIENSKITTVIGALIPIEDVNTYRYFPEILYSAVAAQNGTYGTKAYKVGRGPVSINLNELQELTNSIGSHKLVVVQLDANGNNHGGLTFDTPYNIEVKWKELGDATIEENIHIIYTISTNEPIISGTCKIEEAQNIKGFYRLVNAFDALCKISDSSLNWSYTPTHIYIDATNPEAVNITNEYGIIPQNKFGVPSGIIDRDYGEIYINSYANFNKFYNASISSEDFGYQNDNIITFEGSSIIIGIPAIEYIKSYESALIRITLPISDETAIESITPSDNDENEIEYFNLQGIKVTNPKNGLFIERRGNKAVKRILR